MDPIYSKIKRMLLFLLITAALFGMTSCGGMAPKGDPAQEIIYDTDYSITYYYGPNADQFTEEEVIRMKEAGFDMIPLQRFSRDIEKNKEALSLLAKHGLNAALTEGRIADVYYASPEPSQEKVDEVVAEVVADYAEFDNLKEWILCDEPTAAKFSILGKLVDAFRRLDPGRKTFINLLPNYAVPDMLGTEDYETYLTDFCEIVKPDYLCYDNYEFIGAWDTTQRRGLYLSNMEIARKVADKYGLETRVIVLLTKHGPYSYVSAAEIAWQSNTSLLYGMKGLSFFTYWLPDDDDSFVWSEAMINEESEPTEHYYNVQSQNKTTRVLGNALYNTNVEKVFKLNAPAVTEEIEEYTSYGVLKNVEKGEELLLSFYENGWFMVMNANSVGNTARLETKKLSGTLYWLNPETGKWEAVSSCPYLRLSEDGKYTFKFQPGEAVLLRTAK